MKRRRGNLRVGTCGYVYDHWRGRLYPERLPKSKWFDRYAEFFDTVELNNTFYRLPEAATFERWGAAAPPGFLFAVKFSRFGTHLKRLKDPDEPIRRFLDRAEHLGPKLGPILVQLPPSFALYADRLDAFLAQAGTSHRWAVEVRDERWLVPEVYEILRSHGAALCIHDMIPNHPRELTADFVYLRYHGYSGRYTGRYPRRALAAEAARIDVLLEEGRDLYAYFNNDQMGYAVENASQLAALLRSRAEEKRGKKSSFGS